MALLNVVLYALLLPLLLLLPPTTEAARPGAAGRRQDRAISLRPRASISVEEEAGRASPRPDPIAAVVVTDHVFSANYDKPFVWFDPGKQQALFGVVAAPKRQHSKGLGKRTGGPPATAPVLANGDCLGCDEAANGKTWTIGDFTEQFFAANALNKKGQLQNNCVFYSPVVVDDRQKWLAAGRSASDLKWNPADPTSWPRLSYAVTEWACAQGWQTIWTTWPGKSDDYAQSSSSKTQYNFWEINEPNTWLTPIYPQRFTYFTVMSNTLAQMAGGTIYVMSIDPTNIAKYELTFDGKQSILYYTELQTLAQRYADQSDPLRPTQLIAIDAITPSKTYLLSWTPPYSVIKQLTSRDMRDLALAGPLPPALVTRDTCSANTDYEPSNEDWFG